jgi:hypothetical protein
MGERTKILICRLDLPDFMMLHLADHNHGRANHSYIDQTYQNCITLRMADHNYGRANQNHSYVRRPDLPEFYYTAHGRP